MFDIDKKLYKIIDFSEFKYLETIDKTLTQTLRGTPKYLSPELKQAFF